jgi:hypothetical protein
MKYIDTVLWNIGANLPGVVPEIGKGKRKCEDGELSKQKRPLLKEEPCCCGDRTRTDDLWVMSPTSYHCSTPRCFVGAKVLFFGKPANSFGYFYKNIFFATFAHSFFVCA